MHEAFSRSTKVLELFGIAISIVFLLSILRVVYYTVEMFYEAPAWSLSKWYIEDKAHISVEDVVANIEQQCLITATVESEMEQQKLECYMGLRRFWGDDFIGDLFANVDEAILRPLLVPLANILIFGWNIAFKYDLVRQVIPLVLGLIAAGFFTEAGITLFRFVKNKLSKAK